LEELCGRRFKLLKVLVEEGGELNISTLAARAGMNNQIAWKALRLLIDAKLVTIKHYGSRIKIVRLNVDNPRIRTLKTLIEIWEGNNYDFLEEV